MARALALIAALVVLAGCRGYDLYPRLTRQAGLLPADRFAGYGREQAEAVAIGREFAAAHRGGSPEERARQAEAAAAYARSLPDVVTVTPDPLGYRLTVQFKSGWRVAVIPIDDGKRGPETPNLPPGAAPPRAR